MEITIIVKINVAPPPARPGTRRSDDDLPARGNVQRQIFRAVERAIEESDHLTALADDIHISTPDGTLSTSL